MLDRENVVFVLIDVQERLARLTCESESLIKNITILIEGMKVLDIPVIYLEQYPKGLGSTIPELLKCLESYRNNTSYIEKSTFSTCGSQKFLQKLEDIGRKQVIVAGIETHVCIYQSCRDLLKHSYEVHLVTDAVSSRTKRNRQLGIKRCQEMGSILTGVEMALFELLKESGTPEFKAISKLVK